MSEVIVNATMAKVALRTENCRVVRILRLDASNKNVVFLR